MLTCCCLDLKAKTLQLRQASLKLIVAWVLIKLLLSVGDVGVELSVVGGLQEGWALQVDEQCGRSGSGDGASDGSESGLHG